MWGDVRVPETSKSEHVIVGRKKSQLRKSLGLQNSVYSHARNSKETQNLPMCHKENIDNHSPIRLKSSLDDTLTMQRLMAIKTKEISGALLLLNISVKFDCHRESKGESSYQNSRQFELSHDSGRCNIFIIAISVRLGSDGFGLVRVRLVVDAQGVISTRPFSSVNKHRFWSASLSPGCDNS